MDTKISEITPSEYILRTCNIGNGPGTYIQWMYSPKHDPGAQGGGRSLMHSYELGILERRLSGKVHIRGPHT